MDLTVSISRHIEELLRYAEKKGLIESVDLPYYRNLLLDVFHLDAPAEADLSLSPAEIPETSASLTAALFRDAVDAGLVEDRSTQYDLFSARIMGLLTPSPAQTRRQFSALLDQQGPQAATDWFYQLCRDCDYIKVEAIAQNIRYFAQTRVGELEITINLSKPEKDPKEIARLKNAPSVGYPRCMLCVENPGYAGRENFPARQNHRMIPLQLGGEDWYLQYSPYAYYDEHCIVLRGQHVPMKIDRTTFERLFEFVEIYPHYMLGSNADLPIVGGSILNHDHFQGGRYSFPMDKAGVRVPLQTRDSRVRAWIVDWPMSAVRLACTEKEPLIEMAELIRRAWQRWSDPACDVLAFSDDTPHNTITPILRKNGDEYVLTLVLRNNRVSEEHPLGIFHPHAELHHIKKENIGLIEVMGLFILPGRLKNELAALVPWLTGEKPLAEPAQEDPSWKHYPWLCDIVARRGLCASEIEASAVLREEVAEVCARVLEDAGVYKHTEAGLAGMLRFLASVEMTSC